MDHYDILIIGGAALMLFDTTTLALAVIVDSHNARISTMYALTGPVKLAQVWFCARP